MSQTQSIIFFAIIIIASIITILFFKNKYSKQVSTLPHLHKEQIVDNAEIEKLKQESLEKDKNYLGQIAQLEKALLESKSTIPNGYVSVSELQSLQDKVSNEQQIKNKKEAELNSTINHLTIQKEEMSLKLSTLQSSFDTQTVKENELKRSISELESLVANLSNEKQELNKVIEEHNTPVEQIKTPQDKTILVVDDSSVVRNKMKKLLEGQGYHVVTANDGKDALDKFSGQHFDLVITDLEMPHLDGFGLIKQISENSTLKDIPVMAITGHEEIKVQVSQSESLHGVHKKPWKDEEILKKINRLANVKK